MGDRHLIDQLLFDIQMDQVGLEQAPWDDWPGLCRDRLLVVIEKVFQEFTPPGGIVYRLDSLEVDLGVLPATFTAEEVEARLQEVLRQRLEDSLPRGDKNKASPDKSGQVLAIPAPLAELEQLEFYLQQGLLPWNAKHPESYDLPKNIRRHAAIHGARLKTLLLQDDRALERTIRQIPDAALADLLATLSAPEGHPHLSLWLPQMRQQAVAAPGTEARYRIWRLAFRQRLQPASAPEAPSDRTSPASEQGREPVPGMRKHRSSASSSGAAEQTPAQAAAPQQLGAEDGALGGSSDAAPAGVGIEAVTDVQASGRPSTPFGLAEDSGTTLAGVTNEGVFQGPPGSRISHPEPDQALPLSPGAIASRLIPTAKPRQSKSPLGEHYPTPALEPSQPVPPSQPEATASPTTEENNAAVEERPVVRTHRQPTSLAALLPGEDWSLRKNRETHIPTATSEGEISSAQAATTGHDQSPLRAAAMETRELTAKDSSLPAPDKAAVPGNSGQTQVSLSGPVQAKEIADTTIDLSAIGQEERRPNAPSLPEKPREQKIGEVAPPTNPPLDSESPTPASAADTAGAPEIMPRESTLPGHAPSFPEMLRGQSSPPGNGPVEPANIALQASGSSEKRSPQTADAPPGAMPWQHQTTLGARPTGASDTGRGVALTATSAPGNGSQETHRIVDATVPVAHDVQPLQEEVIPLGQRTGGESEYSTVDGLAPVLLRAALPPAEWGTQAPEGMISLPATQPPATGQHNLNNTPASPQQHRVPEGAESRPPARNAGAPLSAPATDRKVLPTENLPQEEIPQAKPTEMRASAKQHAANRGPTEVMEWSNITADMPSDNPKEASVAPVRTSTAFATLSTSATDSISASRSDARTGGPIRTIHAEAPGSPLPAKAESASQGDIFGTTASEGIAASSSNPAPTPAPTSNAEAAPAMSLGSTTAPPESDANDQSNADKTAHTNPGETTTIDQAASAGHAPASLTAAEPRNLASPAVASNSAATTTPSRQADGSEGRPLLAPTTPMDASEPSPDMGTPLPPEPPRQDKPEPSLQPETHVARGAPGERLPRSVDKAGLPGMQEDTERDPYLAEQSITPPLPSRAWVENALAAGGHELELRLAPLLADPILVTRMTGEWPETLLARLMTDLRTEEFARLQPYAEVMTAANTWPDNGTRRRHHWQYLASALFPTPRFTSAAPFVCGYGDFMASLAPGRGNFRAELCANLAANPAQSVLNQHIRYWLQGKGMASPPASSPAPLLPNSGLLISNAGQVLIAPYLPRLFDLLGLLEKGRFIDGDHARRACHLLQYVVDERSDKAEHELALNKLLCGLELQQPLEAGIDVSEREIAVIDSLLKGVIANWGALGSTSIAGLRQTFLQRGGTLSFQDEAWHLKVEPAAFDVLMDRLPWGLSIVRYSWMTHPVMVDWR